jgi:Protein of unknown function (DUF3800)
VLVCIDESGCAGFKAASTPCFVVAMVIFHQNDEAEKTSAHIANVRERLKVKPEFKFSKCSDDLRTQFFALLSDHHFRVRAVVVEKVKIYSAHLRSEPEHFYNFFLQNLMRHNEAAIKGASIKIDGSGDRRFKRALFAYLRKQLAGGTIKKLKFANSRNDNLIQLADMAAGAIARSYPGRNRAPDARWRRMLQKQIDNVWEFR